MSNKKALIYLGVFIAIIMGLMYFLFGSGDRHGWRVHYNYKSKDPYGTYLLQNLLQDYFDDEAFEVIKGDLDRNLNLENNSGNYIYLGRGYWLDSMQASAILRFAARGNNVFIATPSLQLSLLDSIGKTACNLYDYPDDADYEDESIVDDTVYYDDAVYLDEEGEYYGEDAFYYDLKQPVEDSIALLNFSHPHLHEDQDYRYTFKQRFGPEVYGWEYLPSVLFCKEQTVFAGLGTLNDTLVNFARAGYGNGYIYIHTIPIAFTNYFLDQPRGLEYAEKIFSHLTPGTVYWDSTPRGLEDYTSNRSGSGRPGFGESPLKYILSQPPLAWAWYILLGMALLYLIFKAKRRQRIIPVLERNENTSLEFINTIGRLHFTQSNHRQLALQKMKLFLGFVRERYHISTKEWNDTFRKLLVTKSEIPEGVINKIFTIHGNIERSNFSSENTLIEFHRAMEYFYLNCK